jgi:hypothetical protein
MKPEGSLPHSREPAISPYPEPDQSSLGTRDALLNKHKDILVRIF